MDSAAVTVQIVPLVPGVALPQQATARTRHPIPSGYGVQEQCLPFTAASALGFLIPSPIRFGLCIPEEVPPGSRTMRSPLDLPGRDGHFADPRVFYVVDDASLKFQGNAYAFEGVPTDGSPVVLEPGISFFDRPDQQHLFKLHLPYVWRTSEGIDALFLPLMNRPSKGVEVQSGLVETDWYPSPVNLILAKPAGGVHFQVGDPIAHAILVPRNLRKPVVEVAATHSRLLRETRKGLAEWDKKHSADRGAYKVLLRGRQEQID